MCDLSITQSYRGPMPSCRGAAAARPKQAAMWSGSLILLVNDMLPFACLIAVVPTVAVTSEHTCSCATTFEELDPSILSLVRLFAVRFSSPRLDRSKRQTNAFAAAGPNLQIKLLMRFQSRSYVAKTDVSLKVNSRWLPRAAISLRSPHKVSSGYAVISSRVWQTHRSATLCPLLR
jgi:hypothetical protein